MFSEKWFFSDFCCFKRKKGICVCLNREEKRRKERTRYELLYLFIIFCMFGSENKMETLLLMQVLREKQKKGKLLWEIDFNKGKVFPRNEWKSRVWSGFSLPCVLKFRESPLAVMKNKTRLEVGFFWCSQNDLDLWNMTKMPRWNGGILGIFSISFVSISLLLLRVYIIFLTHFYNFVMLIFFKKC